MVASDRFVCILGSSLMEVHDVVRIRNWVRLDSARLTFPGYTKVTVDVAVPTELQLKQWDKLICTVRANCGKDMSSLTSVYGPHDQCFV